MDYILSSDSFKMGSIHGFQRCVVLLCILIITGKTVELNSLQTFFHNCFQAVHRKAQWSLWIRGGGDGRVISALCLFGKGLFQSLTSLPYSSHTILEGPKRLKDLNWVTLQAKTSCQFFLLFLKLVKLRLDTVYHWRPNQTFVNWWILLLGRWMVW